MYQSWKTVIMVGIVDQNNQGLTYIVATHVTCILLRHGNNHLPDNISDYAQFWYDTTN